MRRHYFIGNGAYCYANSTAMLLASIGETISPALIEVLCGDSLGTCVLKKEHLLYFDNPVLPPDLGIIKALDILGFSYKNRYSTSPEDFPINELKQDLEESPAVLGPVDLGHLTYNHSYSHLGGADHFILVYGVDGENAYINDPEGFAHVFLPLENLKSAWMADRLTFPYNVGYYRYTTKPKRIESPSDRDIYQKAISWFRQIYTDSKNTPKEYILATGSAGLKDYAEFTQKECLDDAQKSHLTHFALPLAAKRASDYSRYFEPYNKQLSDVKYEQSTLFGKAQVFASSEDWANLAGTFGKIAEVEDSFKSALFS